MKVAVIIFSCLVSYTLAACPKIVSRAEWGARAPTEINYRAVPVPFALIHHTAGNSCSTQAECSQQARNVQAFEMDDKGYSDISYSFLVGEDGSVYEGRGWDRIGGHATGHNTDSIGICFFGTFTDRKPNAAALSAAQQLIACSVDNGKLTSTYKLVGHRQSSSTECPGNQLYAEIQTWPHYTANP